MKKICVFPNDPLEAYHKKGEIKPRYFNPKNLFDEVHVISMFDSDIEEDKVKVVAGSASFKIHTTGKVNLLNRKSMKKKVVEIIKKIREKTGEKFIIIYRLSMLDLVEDGNTLTAIIAQAKAALGDLDLPFCDAGSCYADPTVQRIREAIERAATVTLAVPTISARAPY